MTYNVRDLSGTSSIHRVARVIDEAKADLIALQELTCSADDGIDPPQQLASELQMHASFVCSVVTKQGDYGHALLSRHPTLRVRYEILPGHPTLRTEPRSAVAHEVEIAGRMVRVVSTHLALTPAERDEQMRAIAEKGWFDTQNPVLFLGDLNCLPSSRALRVLEGRLRRATSRYIPTWPAPLPFLSLDHIFVSSHFEVLEVRAVSKGIARWTSDHIPLLAEVELE